MNNDSFEASGAKEHTCRLQPGSLCKSFLLSYQTSGSSQPEANHGLGNCKISDCFSSLSGHDF